jgi:hypothetical protein
MDLTRRQGIDLLYDPATLLMALGRSGEIARVDDTVALLSSARARELLHQLPQRTLLRPQSDHACG